MKIKINQILLLSEFLNNNKFIKMPVKTAYKFSKIDKIIKEEMEFYQNKINEIIECYGEKNNNGDYVILESGIKIKEDFRVQCQQEIIELENLEIEIADIFFTLDELEIFQLSINDLGILEQFIQE